MGILKLILAIGLGGLLIAAIVRLMPDQSGKRSKFEDCEKCGGTGVIEELRGKVTCHVCRGSGKLNR